MGEAKRLVHGARGQQVLRKSLNRHPPMIMRKIPQPNNWDSIMGTVEQWNKKKVA
jgi:hypothetical protein